MNYAINKKALVENVLQNTATVVSGQTPAAFSWAYNDALQPYPYDPAKARELAKAAGVEGEILNFYVTEVGSGMIDPVPRKTAIQPDLKAIGLNVKIESYEWNTFLGKVNPGLEGKADMAEMAWMTNDPDTLPFLALRTSAWPDQGGFNSGYYSNPQVDELLEQALVSTSQTGSCCALQGDAAYRERGCSMGLRGELEAKRCNWKQCAKLPFRAILHLAPSQSYKELKEARGCSCGVTLTSLSEANSQ